MEQIGLKWKHIERERGGYTVMAEEFVEEKNESPTDAEKGDAVLPELPVYFSGKGFHSVDDKNRIKFPVEIRDQLGDNRFCLVKAGNHVVYVYPEKTAKAKLNDVYQELQKEGLSPSRVAAFRKYVSSFTPVVDVDSQGRFNFPQWLMDWGGISKKDQLVTIGFIDHFEIWRADRYRALEEENEEDYGDVLASIKVY